MNIDTGNPQFITFLKNGIRRDCSEWSLPGSTGQNRLFNKSLICFVIIPANGNSTLMVNFPKNLNHWRSKDRIPGEWRYDIHNNDLNAPIEAPFGVLGVFPDTQIQSLAVIIYFNISQPLHPVN